MKGADNGRQEKTESCKKSQYLKGLPLSVEMRFLWVDVRFLLACINPDRNLNIVSLILGWNWQDRTLQDRAL